MAKLYIANCTKQHQDFQYRIPETGKITQQHIAAGAQAIIYKDASVHELEAIVVQHAHYGLVTDREARKTKDFVGLCYSIGEPVKLDTIAEVMEHNDQALEQRSQEVREESVQATEHQMREGLQETTGNGEGMSDVSVEIIEQKAPNDNSGETFKQTIASENTKQGNKGRR